MDFLVEKGTLLKYLGDACEVTIPPEVERIGQEAFSGSAVKRVVFPGSVKEIDSCAFYQCQALEEVSFSFGLISIGAYAFAKCPLLTRLGEFPLTLKEIGEGAFSHTGITEVHLRPFVEKIGNNAFGYCEHLYTVSLPKLYDNGFDPFRGSPWILDWEADQVIYENGVAVGLRDENATDIRLMKNTTEIGMAAFAGTGIRSITIPPSVKSISRYAFSLCHSLETVIMETGKDGAGPELIQEKAFYECEALKHMELGNRVRVIEKKAFERCKSLRKIALPSSLLVLEQQCFYRSGLLEADLPAGLRYVEKGAFARSKLKTVRNHSMMLRYFAKDALLMQNGRRQYCLPVDGIGVEAVCRTDVTNLIGEEEETALQGRPIGGGDPAQQKPVLRFFSHLMKYQIDVVQGERLPNNDWLFYGYFCAGDRRSFISVTADELLRVTDRWIAYAVA